MATGDKHPIRRAVENSQRPPRQELACLTDGGQGAERASARAGIREPHQVHGVHERGSPCLCSALSSHQPCLSSGA